MKRFVVIGQQLVNPLVDIVQIADKRYKQKAQEDAKHAYDRKAHDEKPVLTQHQMQEFKRFVLVHAQKAKKGKDPFSGFFIPDEPVKQKHRANGKQCQACDAQGDFAAENAVFTRKFRLQFYIQLPKWS